MARWLKPPWPALGAASGSDRACARARHRWRGRRVGLLHSRDGQLRVPTGGQTWRRRSLLPVGRRDTKSACWYRPTELLACGVTAILPWPAACRGRHRYRTDATSVFSWSVPNPWPGGPTSAPRLARALSGRCGPDLRLWPSAQGCPSTGRSWPRRSAPEPGRPRIPGTDARGRHLA